MRVSAALAPRHFLQSTCKKRENHHLVRFRSLASTRGSIAYLTPVVKGFVPSFFAPRQNPSHPPLSAPGTSPRADDDPPQRTQTRGRNDCWNRVIHQRSHLTVAKAACSWLAGTGDRSTTRCRAVIVCALTARVLSHHLASLSTPLLAGSTVSWITGCCERNTLQLCSQHLVIQDRARSAPRSLRWKASSEPAWFSGIWPRI